MAISLLKRALRTNRIMFFLLALSVAGNIYLFATYPSEPEESEMITTETEVAVNIAKELREELEMTSAELEKYKGISKDLDSVIVEANEELKVQENKIQQLAVSQKKAKEKVELLQMELADIQKLKEGYLDRIDDLLVQNDLLMSQNMTLTRTLQLMQHEVNDLKQKVNIGSHLLADNIEVKPIKKTLFGKYKPTTMSNRTKKLEISFDVLENKLVKSDEKKIFVRIISPDGNIIYDQEGRSGITINPVFENEMMYTFDDEFQYRNKKQKVTLEWDAPLAYEEGTYVVELYTSKNKMGVGSFTLR